MFSTSLDCGIKSVKVKAKDVDGRMVRRCVVTLAHEFTAGIARALGDDALAVRDAIRDHSVEKAVMPIDSIAAIGAFKAGDDAVEIGRMIGLKATALSAKNDDDGPTVQLEFEFVWQEDAWVFLGRHCNTVATGVLTQRQLMLAANDTNN